MKPRYNPTPSPFSPLDTPSSSPFTYSVDFKIVIIHVYLTSILSIQPFPLIHCSSFSLLSITIWTHPPPLYFHSKLFFSPLFFSFPYITLSFLSYLLTSSVYTPSSTFLLLQSLSVELNFWNNFNYQNKIFLKYAFMMNHTGFFIHS